MHKLPRLRQLAATLLLSAAAVCATPGAASAAACDRYAAPTGSDAAAGTAQAPFRTAQALAVSLQPGETGCLRAGTYDQEIEGPYVIRFNHGGAPGRPITVRNAPGESVLLRGIVYVPRGSDDVTLAGVSIDGRRPVAAEAPVSVQTMAARTVIEDNDITNNGARSCMIIGSDTGWGAAKDTIVRRNVFHDCGDKGHGMLDHAIYSDNVDGAEIVDNVFVRNAAFAVHLYPNTTNSVVAHNVMVDNGGGVIVASYDDFRTEHNTIEQNVIAGSRNRAGISTYWTHAPGQGNVEKRNCMFNPRHGNLEVSSGGLSSGGGTYNGDPLFADAATGDYRLGSSRCLEAVGYDTAAKLRGAATVAPAPDAPTADAPAPAPDPAPAAPAPGDDNGSEAGTDAGEADTSTAFTRSGRSRKARARRTVVRKRARLARSAARARQASSGSASTTSRGGRRRKSRTGLKGRVSRPAKSRAQWRGTA